MDSLTDREREIATLVCSGFKDKEIANQIGITEAAVRHHITAIFHKLDVGTRIELLLFFSSS